MRTVGRVQEQSLQADRTLADTPAPGDRLVAFVVGPAGLMAIPGNGECVPVFRLRTVPGR